MSLRVKICLSILLLNYAVAFSQLYYVNLPPGHNKLHLGDDRIPGVVGSPFLAENWDIGSIVLKNGNVIDSLPLRYNVYSKEIHFQSKNDTYILGSPDSVLSIRIKDKQLVYLPFEDNKHHQAYDYFEIISAAGMVQVLLRHTVTIVRSNYNIALNAGEKDDRIEHKSVYYLKKDNSVVQVDRRGANLYSLLKDKAQELKEYASKNRISFNNGDDLTRMAEYYNTLYFK